MNIFLEFIFGEKKFKGKKRCESGARHTCFRIHKKIVKMVKTNFVYSAVWHHFPTVLFCWNFFFSQNELSRKIESLAKTPPPIQFRIISFGFFVNRDSNQKSKFKLEKLIEKTRMLSFWISKSYLAPKTYIFTMKLKKLFTMEFLTRKTPFLYTSVPLMFTAPNVYKCP